ncbi:MAG: HYR domain-containing protein [Bacteroidota bacterium]
MSSYIAGQMDSDFENPKSLETELTETFPEMSFDEIRERIKAKEFSVFAENTDPVGDGFTADLKLNTSPCNTSPASGGLGCPYLGSQFGSANAPTILNQEEVIATCIFGGEFIRINNLQAGATYNINTCDDTDFDTEMTLFPVSGGPPLAYNNDGCGTSSNLNFTPVQDMSIDMQINQSLGCLTNNICMTVRIMLINVQLLPGTISAPNVICAGETPLLFEFTSASGGTPGVSGYSYQWQQSVNCTGVWVDIPLATGVSYTPPPLLSTTCFRRVVIDDCMASEATSQVMVTVSDPTPPVITCPVDVFINTLPGQCGRTITYPTPTATDNCPAMVTVARTSGPASGSFFSVGTTTVTYEATDGIGNSSTCSFDVNVNDNENPVISCPSNITLNNDPGQCGANVTYTSPTATDNCPGVTVARIAGPASGDPFPTGTTIVTWRATDASSNTDDCSFNVTVNDNENPDAICQDITIQIDGSLMISLTANDINNGSTDNCAIDNFSLGGTVDYTCADVGQVFNVTLNATDAAGNNDNCVAAVTVQDMNGFCNSAPNAVCQDVTVDADANCVDIITVATDFDGGSSDPDGDPITFSVSPTPPYQLGSTNVTLTVTDNNNNVATCSATVTVEDNMPPVIICPGDITIECDEDPNQTMANATDNCDPNPSISPGDVISAGSCPSEQTITRTWTATDNAGNPSSCIQIITVVDTEDPEITCPSNITVNNDPGLCSATVTFVATATDNCGTPSITYAPQGPGSSFNVGTTTITATAEDACGETAQCTFTLTVNNTEPPTITNVSASPMQMCEGGTTTLTVTGNLNNATTWEWYSGNCGGTPVGSGTSITVSPVTTNVYFVRGEGGCVGNSEPCGNVTVVVQPDPAIFINGITTICPGQSATLNPSPGGGVSPCQQQWQVSTTGAGGPFTDTGSPTTGLTPFNTGALTTTSWFRAIRSCAPVSCDDATSNVIQVTVEDTENPTVTCPADITVDNDSGQCGATVNYTTTANDNCPGVSFNCIPASGSFFNVGVTPVTCTATDVAGNTGQCSFNITVNDTEDPTVTCPSDITVDNDPGQCGATVNYTTTANDNCPGVAFNCIPASGSFFNVGVTPVSCTAVDAAGNAAQCSFNITVNDTEDPVATCNDITIQLNTVGNHTLTTGEIDDIANGSSDNCETNFAVSPNMFDCNDVDTNVAVTLTVTDDAGNSADCTANVFVTDPLMACNQPPVAACQNLTVNAGPNCMDMTTLAADFDGGSTDPDGDPLIFSVNPAGPYPLGTTTVTLTVSDGSFTDNCTATITVVDNTPPMVTCPSNLIIECDESTEISNTGIASISDNCPIGPQVWINEFHYDNVSGDTGEFIEVAGTAGVNLVGWSIVLYNGNDNLTYNTVALAGTIDNEGSGYGALGFAQPGIQNGAPDGLALVDPSGNVIEFLSYEGTITAANGPANGMTSTDVGVEETGSTPAGESLQRTGNGSRGSNFSWSGPANDSPGDLNADQLLLPAGLSYIDVLSAGSCLQESTITRTWTAIDDAGNTSSCDQIITIDDSTVPVVSCPSNTTVNNDPGQCGAVVSFTPTATDNCGTPGIISSPASGSLFSVGTTTVTVTATDDCGNQSDCTFSVTVNDNEDPAIACPPNVTVNNDPGNCGAVVTYNTPSGNDNCPGSVTNLTAGLGSGSTFPVGSTTETYTVVDAAGNSASCSFTVTVNDNENPSIVCPANITVNNDPGDCWAFVNYATPTGNDNCPGPVTNQTAGLGSGSTFPVGITTETFTVVDAVGNSANCSFTITVNDNENPTIACPANITVDNDPGDCGAVVSYAPPTGNDNCPGPVTNQTAGLGSGSTFPVGITTETYTVVDASGNSASCSFTITVNDNENPTIACPVGPPNPPIPVPESPEPNGNPMDPGVPTLLGTAILTGLADGAPNVDTWIIPPGTSGDISVFSTAPGVLVNVNCFADDMYLIPGGGGGSYFGGPPMTFTLDPANYYTISVGAFFPGLPYVVEVTGSSLQTFAPLAPIEWTPGFNESPVPSNTPQDPLVDPSLTGMPTVGDNCPGGTTSYQDALVGPNPNNCPVLWTVERTWTYTDAAGNSVSCLQVIELTDTTPPVVSCPGNITTNSDQGTCGAVVPFGASASDNCGTPTLSYSQNPGTLFPVGSTTVTVTATDNCNNTSTCTFDITVNDNEAPTAICQDVTVQLDANGTGSTTAQDVDNGSNDACGITSLSLDVSTFDCNDVSGGVVVTLTVMDQNNNASTCTANVTVEDGIPPVALCQDITIQLDANGDGSITPQQIDDGSNDACNIASLSVAPNSFTCNDVGSNPVTLTVTDHNNNVSTCFATVTVEDNIPPVAICQDVTVQLDANGNGSASAQDVDNGSNDNCGVASISLNPSTFDCSNIGNNTVTLTVVDVNNNSSTCTANATVEDNIAPSAVCADLTVQLDAGGSASVTPQQVDNGSDDACGIASLNVNGFPFVQLSCANVGQANTIQLNVEDVNGNTASCSASITVEDNIPPVAICQDVTVQLDANGNGSTTAQNVDNGSNDNCGIASLSLSQSTFNCSDVGNNTTTLTVLDVNGNSSTCTANVTVEDNIAPTAICQDLTVQLDAGGSASVTPQQVDNGSGDACGIASLNVNGFQLVQLGCANVGQANTVQLNVEDVNGNTASCSASITVEDNIPPVAICQDVTVQLDANGNGSTTAQDVDNGSNDNCGIASLSLSQSTFNCSDVGNTTTTLTVLDVNGNSSTCTANVTVEDNVPPVAICQDVTVQLDPQGNGSVTAQQVDNGSSDNCGIASISVNPNTFSCNNGGNNTVTLTVVDVNGNSSTCTANVTIEDPTPPVAICQDVTVQLDASGNGSITAQQVDNGSSDNCGIASISVSPSTFDCSDVGNNTVTLTVTDTDNNASTCTSNVSVEDNIAPVAICQDITVQLDATGNATIFDAQLDNGSSDACGLRPFEEIPRNFGCSDVGSNTLVLVVFDLNLNQSSCTSIVTVEDNVDPVVVCQDITVQLDNSGNASITADQVELSASDACGIDQSSVSPDTFTCSDIGSPVPVILSVTDVNGNVGTCTANVTVEDNTPPVAVCNDLTVQLDASGNATFTANDVGINSSDICGNLSLSIDINSFTCNEVGPNTVTLTVDDNNGNTATCTSTVTVEDNVAPNAECQDVNVNLSPAGTATIAASDVDNGSNDACGIAGISLSQTTFDCNDVGGNTTTILTVTDSNGNSATCSATVNVFDITPPVAVCADLTIQLDGNGEATITTSQVGGSSTDNCAIDNLMLDKTTFDCGNVGQNFVMLTVVDNSGNSDNCTAEIIVEDNTDPTATCTDITVQLDQSGNASITASQVDGGSTDNCGIGALSININSFDCADQGDNTVVLTVTDSNGNTSTCSATVTVENGNPIVLSSTVTDESGPGILDGAIDLTISGGMPPYQVLWSNGETTEDIGGLAGLQSYIVTVLDDNGCSASATIFVDQGNLQTVELCLTTYLGGMFDPLVFLPTPPMRTTLRDQDLIPLQHPYNMAPWNYNGPEAFPTLPLMPLDMSDWLLMNIRDGVDPSIILYQEAVILHNNGSINSVDGQLPQVVLNPGQLFFVELVHYNHLPISTPLPFQVPVTGGQFCHDFTTSLSQAFDNPILNDDPMLTMPSVNGVLFGMVPGNVQSLDLQIDANDANLLFINYLSTGVYAPWDANGDGMVDLNDVNLLFFSYGRNAHTPY